MSTQTFSMECRNCHQPIEFTRGKAFVGFVHANGHLPCESGLTVADPRTTISDTIETVDRVLAKHPAKGTCGSQFVNRDNQSQLCGKRAVTFCRDCGTELCEDCKPKELYRVEVLCETCKGLREASGA